MKKTFRIAIACLFITNFFNANSQIVTDEIRLINGKSIKGIIIEQKPGEYIKIIESIGKDTLLLKIDEIDVMKKNYETLNSQRPSNQQSDSLPASLLYRKKFNFYVYGGDFRSVMTKPFYRQSNNIGFMVQRVLNKRWAVSLGIESIDKGNGFKYLPIYANASYFIARSDRKYYLPKKIYKFTSDHYLSASIGYIFNSTPLSKQNSEGVTENLGSGYLMRIGYGTTNFLINHIYSHTGLQMQSNNLLDTNLNSIGKSQFNLGWYTCFGIYF